MNIKKMLLKIFVFISFLGVILTTASCKSCKDKKEDNCIHEESNWIIDVNATCSKEGSKHKECTICHEVLIEKTIQKLNHDIEHHEGKNATCEEDGYKPYDTCKNCSYTTYEEIKTSGHNYSNYICKICFEPSPENLKYELMADNSGYYISGLHNTNINKIIIPEVYNGKTVVKIGSAAFSGCSSLTSITIPSSVTSIGFGAFIGCSNLTSLTLPFIPGEYLGYFFGATSYYDVAGLVPKSLKEVIILDGCTSIGIGAFYNCSSLESIVIPSSLITIGSSAFSYCSSLGYNEYDNGYYLGNVENPYLILVKAKDKDIKSITINESTKIICDSAFKDCGNLTKVTIPSSVTSIGKYTFSGCSSLTSITLPFIPGGYLGYIFGAKSSSYNSEYVPSSLKKVIILEGCTSIGEGAFSGCSSLTSIEIPFSLTSIGSSAFSGCSSLGCNEYDNVYYLGNVENPYLILVKVKNKGIESIKINENTKIICDSAFYNCSNLTSITIPSSVTRIEKSAFYGCSFESITLPFIGGTKDTNTYLGYIFGASSSNYNSEYVPKSLKEVIILEGCTSIGSYAFRGCSSLTSIEIPSSVTSIESHAFRYCSSLESIEIPSSVTSIGYWAFSGCSSLGCNEYDNGYYLGNVENPYLILVKAKDKDIKSITINESTKIICDSVFYNCSNLTSITIPSSVTRIEKSAFYGCSFESITLPFIGETKDTNTYLGYIFGAKSSGYNSEYVPSSLKEVIILEGCTSIGEGAFSECSSLTSIEIPSSVTSIGWGAFYNCSSLGYNEYDNGYYLGNVENPYLILVKTKNEDIKSIKINENTKIICDSAFKDCGNLTKVTIPSSVTSIGYLAFVGSSLGYNEYDNGYYLGNVENPYLILVKAKDKDIKSITINESTKIICDSAFKDCGNLTKVTIPSSVTSIGKYTFSGCSSLTSITLPFIPGGYLGYIFGAKSSSYNSEYVPSSLKKVIILEGCTSIGSSAFSYCSNLEIIEIPSSVTSIGSSAFWGCSSLTSIEIPSNVTSIGEYAFYNCSRLTNITIPTSVISIGESVFYGCSNLIIYFKASNKSSDWDDYWNYSDSPYIWNYKKNQ